jgi:predicted amidohydrolase YtcJ
MLVIHNAKIHTQYPAIPFASALAIDNGRIVAVGTDDEILASFSTNKPFNAQGLTIIPGLTDAHIHLEALALSQQKVDCETQTLSECLRRVAERVAITPPGEWILGHGWNQNTWAEGYGNASNLDVIAPYNPICLTHKSLHSAWVNSSALHRAAIDRETPDPVNGRIGRTQSGDPDGILFESAMDPLRVVILNPAWIW